MQALFEVRKNWRGEDTSNWKSRFDPSGLRPAAPGGTAVPPVCQTKFVDRFLLSAVSIEVTFDGGAPAVRIESAGEPMRVGEIDRAGCSHEPPIRAGLGRPTSWEADLRKQALWALPGMKNV
jgi:hypothetical protein